MKKEARLMLIGNRVRRTGIAGVLLGSVCVLTLLIVSCGGDDPTTPGQPPPPPDDQLPAIPVMTDPNVEPPVRSEVLSIIRPARDYVPRITAALTTLKIRSQGRFEEWPTWLDCYGPWQDQFNETAWTNGDIPLITGCINACGLVNPFCEPNQFYPPGGFDANLSQWPERARFVFLKDGVKDPGADQIKFEGAETEYCMVKPGAACLSKCFLRFEYTADRQSLVGTPHLRRDRLWVAQRWETGALVHQIQGESETRMKTSWMVGVDETQIKTFAYSLGGIVDAAIDVLKSVIEGSVSESFDTEVTVREATETSVEKVLAGKAGKLTCHMYFALVDRYSFVNEDGTRFADPNYVFDEGYHDPVLDTYCDLEMVGVIAERVVTYEFDLITGTLPAVTEHPATK